MNNTSEKQVMKILSIMLMCGFGLIVDALGIPTAPYSHTVTKKKPLAYGKYMVRADDSTAELITNCGAPDKFKPETDEVVISRKHDVMWKIPVRNDEVQSRAVSPIIPGADSSYVFVIGEFLAGAGGGRGGAGGPVVPPQWGSMLKEPGVHVILLHQYDANHQERPGFNLAVAGSGEFLEEQYKGDGHRVLLVKVGVGGDITDISGLPAYLASQEVKHGTVLTLDTLGHGEQFKRDYTFNDDLYSFFFRFLQSARSSDVDTVGRTEDAEVANKALRMTTAAFCGTFNEYLKEGAFVGLWHCFTAEGYRSPFPLPIHDPAVEPLPAYVKRMNALLENPPAIPAIMGQAIVALKSGVVVAGVSGTVNFDNDIPQADDAFLFGVTQ